MKTLLIGLDGFDYHLTRRWVEEGRLHNLSLLARRGDLEPLPSLVPPLSPAVWTSLLTGVNPARHGVFDFTALEGRKVSLLAGFAREAPNIFEVLSHAGLRVAAVGFPATEPLGEIEGAVLSGWTSPFSVRGGRSGCHPAWIHDALVRVMGRDYLPFDVIDQFGTRGEDGAGEAASKLEASALGRAPLALSLTRENLAGPVDLLAVYFPEGDAAGHHLWHLHDPGSPRRRGGPADEDPLLRVYRGVDRAVGLLLDGFGPEAALIVSDHGMGGSGLMAFSLNRFLADAGFLKMKNGAGDALRGLLEDAALGAAGRLPPAARELAARRGLRSLSDASLTLLRLGGIDWDRTLAFSEDLGYAPSIRLNEGAIRIKGRSKEDVAREVIKKIGETPAVEGAVAAAWLRRDLYRGPFESRIPDILLDLSLDGNYSYNLLPGLFRAMKNPVEPLAPKYLTGQKGRSRHGSHRKEGILIASVPGGGPSAGGLHVYDVAPFILSLHGLEADGYFDSMRSFSGCRKIAPEDLTGAAARHARDDHGSSGDYPAVKSRLEDLGYL
jgi:predicted AlkP superfamily phosphohydrolase/phosphomutase